MIAALVPVKPLRDAKSRLRPLLLDSQRRALAVAMLEDILRLLRGVPGILMTAVVSRDPDAQSLARSLGVQAIAAPPEAHGVNQALRYATDIIVRQGASVLLVLPMDVPLASKGDIQAIVEAAWENPSVVVCRSRRGGVNAVAMQPPGVIPFHFGYRGLAAHRREAAARRVPYKVLEIPSLSFDVDRPEDLKALLHLPRSSRSQRILDAMGLDPESMG